MKFAHIADVHFDRPFVNLSDKEGLGDIRRLEQRKAFKKVIEKVREENIPYLFISGDLYEHKFVKKSTIQFINDLFKEIPNTKVFISPGNHDPYLKNSYYNKFMWNENVHIFNSKFEKVEFDDVDIYGYGFSDFYCSNLDIDNFNIENKEKTNILIIHGTLNGTTNEEKQYNSISKKVLEEKGFDYIALGHIHKPNYDDNKRIVYPGSLVSLGFDEMWEHGMVIGEIDEEKIDIKFIELDEREFIEKNIDVTQIFSKEELIEKINELEIQNNQFVKILLTGKRRFEIDVFSIYKLIENDKIIKIKDKTQIYYELEKIACDNTLKGLFVKEMLVRMNKENVSKEEKKIMEKAIEIAFEALN